MTQMDELMQKMMDLDEDTLKAQLGIHAQEAAQDLTARSASIENLDEMLTAIPRGAVPSGQDVSFGNRLFKRLNVKSYNLLCSDVSDLLGKDDTLNKLKDAYEESAAKAAGFLAPVLIANLGLAPAIAAIISALVIKTISSATAETICEVWQEKLDPIKS
ncbi:MAG TPA: hypothetical protein V6D28_28670 [Leptolyngbyaceae cyanobacterium]